MSTSTVEIIGSPGVGKTTIYNGLCKMWRPTDSWTYPEVLLNPAPAFLAFSDWIIYNLRKILRKNNLKGISLEHGLRYIANNPQLGEFFWEHLSDTRIYPGAEINKRFRSSYLLFSDFCKYQAVLEKKVHKLCIINEGLLQKSFLVHEDKYLMEQVVGKYTSILQFPSALIYVNTTNDNLILNRLLNRNKVIASHMGKTSAELLSDIRNWHYYFELIIAEARVRNIPVFTINAESPVNENVRLLKRMLSVQHFESKESFHSPAFINE